MKRFGLSLALCLYVLLSSCVDGGKQTNNVTDEGISLSEVSGDLIAADTAADSQISDTAQDVTETDAADVKVSEDFGKVCGSDEDCAEGPCVQTANGSVCTQGCDDKCPDGWSCFPPAEGAGDDKICFPNFPTLCMPCSSNSDCLIAGGRVMFDASPRGKTDRFVVVLATRIHVQMATFAPRLQTWMERSPSNASKRAVFANAPYWQK